MPYFEKNNRYKKNDELLRIKKKKSEIEQCLKKKLNVKAKKNDKLFLENQFKPNRLLSKIELKLSIDNFTF